VRRSLRSWRSTTGLRRASVACWTRCSPPNTRRSGIIIGKPNKDPGAFEWRVFSDQSLHEALGLVVEKDNQLLVSQFPELTRITDTGGDGVADRYDTVCDAWGLSGGYHDLGPDGSLWATDN
jgi:hypothetical protein